MALPGSWWLLSVCLLSGCCSASGLGNLYAASDIARLPIVIWNEQGNVINIDTIKQILEKRIPGVYIQSQEIKKDMIEEMKNNVLNAASQVCQMLTNDPKLQQGYIGIIISKRLEFLKEISQRCPMPPMKEMVVVTVRNLIRQIKHLGMSP